MRLKARSGLFLLFAATLGLGGCGGGGGGGGTPNLGGGGVAVAACVTSVAAKAIAENPRTESPAIAFSGNLAGLGSNVTLTGLDGSKSLATFDPNNPRFQQVNAYFYATRARDMAVAAGADLSQLVSLKIDAHCVSAGGFSSTNNAFYLPSANELCFGFFMSGGKKLYASDDSDVIMHEFGHAITHKIASTAIMNSSFESGSIDEGTADYWALTVNGNAALSEWFLGAIDASDANPDPFFQRVATQNHSYPQSMVGEIHFDSRVWAEALWTIRTTLGSTKTNQLVVRAVDLMPATTRYKDGVTAIQSAGSLLNMSGTLSAADLVTIDNALTAKGLKRSDSAVGVALSTDPGHTSRYIIDDHSFSFQVGGNCNGALDVGETAMVMFNLQTMAGGAVLGLGVGTLAAAGGSIGTATIVAAGSTAEYMRLNGNADDFVDVLATSGVFSDDATVGASFLIRGDTAGAVNMTLNFTPMGGAAVAIPVTFTVGAVATRATNCPGGLTANRALWPVP